MEKPKYRREPRDHQREALKISCFRPSWALLMERGTGKTKVIFDTASILYLRQKIDGLLVIAPNDVHTRWITEHLEKDVHENIPYIAQAWEGIKKTKAYVDLLQSLLLADGALKIFSINVEAFASPKAYNYCERFLRAHKTLFVVDESTRIKYPKTRRTKKILKLAPLAVYRRILTGNEITTSPFNAYTQFQFLEPNFWGGMNYFVFTHRYGKFKKIRLKNKKKKDGKPWEFEKNIGYQRLNELRAKVNSISFRAKKSECLDLPDKIYSPIHVDLNEDQKRVYASLKKDLIAEYGENFVVVENKVALYTRFRQICGGFFPETNKMIGENPKLSAILYDMEDVEEPVIIWASFVPELEMLAREFKKTGRKVQLYSGRIKKKDRPAIVDKFQAGEIDVLVANPDVAGTGLNLQRSCLHYFYSNSYKPEPRWQAEDRSHRDGQHWPVVYKDIIARKTIDEKIAKVHIERLDMATFFAKPLKEIL